MPETKTKTKTRGLTLEEAASIIRAANNGLSLILELSEEEKGFKNEDAEGGILCVIMSPYPAHNLMTMAIGKIDDMDFTKHLSKSFASNEHEIKTSTLSFSFNGLPGHWNEVLMIFIALRLGHLTVDEALATAIEKDCMESLEMITF